MRSFWIDPYLWVHLAGLAALPIFLEICFIGLAIGDPVLPVGLELALVAIAGIAPILWMQWQKPFCIFSLVALSLKPDQLTVEQRKLLRLFKTAEVRILAVGAAVVSAIVLWQLYRVAPIASDLVPASGWRLTGLLLAAGAFLVSNLFLQVPVSVMRVLMVSEAQFAAADPYPPERIAKDFTLFGLKVRRILPPLKQEAPAAVIDSSVSPSPRPEPLAEASASQELPSDVALALEESTATTDSVETSDWVEIEQPPTAVDDPTQAEIEADTPAQLESEHPTL
ncbi:low-complexity tail membrane protein [Oculatella sp. LEGE 06141]|uniref:low-complexity tail membrane protein n=1 Tax=Oculatella sp. LEGE 06141 TaxID=1828648 RepID=UPI00187E211F|nr:low-complexity tail membrane protein [Oculatella sp. LEGE 06141]MBE9179170.1 low-complexity tail membrane protein [Oculatella sp. LEGE 06141]